ncbi:MAG: hypothetical protein ACXW2U_08235 [Telluria sp.]
MMKDLFIGECRRFRNAALIFAASHLVLQLFVSRMRDLLQDRWEMHVLVLSVYMIAGLGFALYQYGSYRQPGRWLWLLHRPMAPRAIFAATGMAAACLILFAVGLPALLTVIGADLLTARTVDTRHYLLVVQLVVLTLCAWLAGTYVILNRSRSAFVVMFVPLLLLGHQASAWVMLLPAAVCVALLAAIVSVAFKPDRMAPPSHPAALAAAAAPLMLGFYLALVWGSSLMFQNVQILAGVHPLNTPAPPAGGFTESTRAEGRDLILAGLAHASGPEAGALRRQVALLDVANFEPEGHEYPVRHQASNIDTLQWSDPKRRIDWTFSHDTMRFHGQDMYTGQARGTFGVKGFGGTQPFPAVPVMPGAGHIMTPQHLYQHDEDTGEMRHLIALRAPETVTGKPKQVGQLLYIITNHRLVAYHRPLDNDTGMLREAWSTALPGPFSDLDRIDIAQLLDKSLVSFSYGRAMLDGAGDSAQTIMLVDAAGKASVIARRQLSHDFPQLFEHHGWLVSPVLYAVRALPDVLFDKGYVADAGQAHGKSPWHPRPAGVWAAAVLLSLLSAAGAWYWLRGAKDSPRRKAAWIAASLLLGPASLLSLMVLQARPPQARAIEAPQAAACPA